MVGGGGGGGGLGVGGLTDKLYHGSTPWLDFVHSYWL